MVSPEGCVGALTAVHCLAHSLFASAPLFRSPLSGYHSIPFTQKGHLSWVPSNPGTSQHLRQPWSID